MGISAVLSAAGAVPVGVVNPFAGANAPAGWLLCYGQAVSRTQYPVLFNTLSTTYGVGDGSTTFNIPDMRGRAVAGKDNMGGTAASILTANVLSAANTLGAVGGVETVTLTSAQSGVPAHSHTNTLTNNAVTTGAGSVHSHASTASFSGSFTGSAASHNHTQDAHQHVMNYADGGSFGGTRSVLNANRTTGTDAGEMSPAQPAIQNTSITPSGSISGSVSMSNPSESAHTHSVTSNVSISNVANTAASAASAHTNTQPTIVLNYIIKAQ